MKARLRKEWMKLQKGLSLTWMPLCAPLPVPSTVMRVQKARAPISSSPQIIILHCFWQSSSGRVNELDRGHGSDTLIQRSRWMFSGFRTGRPSFSESWSKHLWKQRKLKIRTFYSWHDILLGGIFVWLHSIKVTVFFCGNTWRYDPVKTSLIWSWALVHI